MNEKIEELKLIADMHQQEGNTDVEQLCITAISALRTVDDLAAITIRLAVKLRKHSPNDEEIEKTLNYLKRHNLQ